MARIAGIDIPREKRLVISLTYIYGIGHTTAAQICEATEHRPVHPGQGPHRRRGRRAPRPHRGATSRSRATCVARSARTSSARWRSAATRACATVVASRSAASAPTPTPGPARVPRRPSPERRRSASELRRRVELKTERSQVMAKPTAGGRRPAEGTQERHPRRGAHQELVQQHDRVDHRPGGQRPRLGLGRQRRASRAPASPRPSPPSWPRSRPPAGPWSMACARSTSW